MPHEYNNIIVVTKDELVPKWYSWDNLKKTINRFKSKPYGIKKIQSGGNGRQLLVAFDSLPNHIQDDLGDPRKLGHEMERYYKTDGSAITFFQNYRFEDGTDIDDKIQARYVVNASMLKTLWHVHDIRSADRIARGGTLRGIMKTLLNDSNSFNRTLKAKYHTEHTLPSSIDRFTTAMKAFATEGYPSIISGKHKNQNSLKVTDPVESLINSIFAGQIKSGSKPNPTEVSRKYNAFRQGFYQVVNEDTGELYQPSEFTDLSESTIKQLLDKYQNKYPTYTLRSGDRQKDLGNWKPYHSLDKPKYAGSIISIDDRQPPFEYEKGERPWFYMAIDLASEACIAWVYGKSKEGIILEFYRQLVRNMAEWGTSMPAELEAEMNLNASYKDTFLSEGSMFQYVRIEANNARGKRIERYFKEFRYGLEKERTGWIARPFALTEANQPGPAKKVYTYYDQLIEDCLRDIEAWNNWPHSSYPEAVADFRAMGYSSKPYKTRWEYWMENQNPNLKPINYLSFIKEIGECTKTSCKVGRVNLKRQKMCLAIDGRLATGDTLISFMERIEGEDIEVYHLDDNDDGILKAYAFMDGHCICELIPEPSYQKARIEQTPADIENRSLMSAYVETIESYGKRRRATIVPVTLVKNTPAAPKTFEIKSLKKAPKISTYNPQEPECLDEDQEQEIPREYRKRSFKDNF